MSAPGDLRPEGEACAGCADGRSRPDGRQGHRLYVAPETPLPITRWDYTEHAPVADTLERGRADARRHAELFDSWLR